MALTQAEVDGDMHGRQYRRSPCPAGGPPAPELACPGQLVEGLSALGARRRFCSFWSPPCPHHRKRNHDHYANSAHLLSRRPRGRRAAQTRSRRDRRQGGHGGPRVPQPRPGAGRCDCRGDGARRGTGRGGAGERRDRGDGFRRLRGQGGQELCGHRVPARLPAWQEIGGGHRRGRRAQHHLRGRADRGCAGHYPGDQPDVDGAVQGDRGRQDPQRHSLPAVTVCGALLRTQPGRAPHGGRSGRDAAGGAAGHPRRRTRGHPLSVQTPRSRFHLGDRWTEDRRAGEFGRKAGPVGRSRERTDLYSPDGGPQGRSRRHPDLENL